MNLKTTLLICIFASLACAHGQTVVGIHGSQFTINGNPTYTAASGFPSADPNLQGTLLNVRAIQAIFDDANYPNGGSRAHPYPRTPWARCTGIIRTDRGTRSGTFVSF